MKYLYISEMPVDREAQKDLDGTATHIDGGQVAVRAFIENVVRFSRQDCIVFPRQPRALCGDFRETDVVRENDSRIRFVNSAELYSQGAGRDIVLLSPSWALDQLLTTRSGFVDRRMPAVSLIHSLCSPSILNHLLTVILSDVRPFDALVSPSLTGKYALRGMWQHVVESLKATGMKSAPQVEIPVIPLGVAEDFFIDHRSSTEKSRVEVLYLGRMSTSSKADLMPLLLVWQKISRAFPNARLTLAGDDTQQRMTSSLLDVSVALGCAESVVVKPNPTAAQKLQLYRESDVFVSPSDSLQETFGLTIVEAMATGLPVVASDWSGYRELIQDGETGFLVPTLFSSVTDDTESGFAQPFLSDIWAASTVVDLEALELRMGQLIGDANLRRKMGALGRDRAMAKFRWPDIIRQHDELWNELRQRSAYSLTRNESATFLEVSPAKFFGHYASQRMNQQVTIKRSTTPSEQARNRLDLAKINHSGAKRMLMVYSVLKDASSIALYKVESEVKARWNVDMNNQEVCHHLGRLAKYGLVDLFGLEG